MAILKRWAARMTDDSTLAPFTFTRSEMRNGVLTVVERGTITRSA